jgi:hypothetical protein
MFALLEGRILMDSTLAFNATARIKPPNFYCQGPGILRGLYTPSALKIAIRR